MLKGKQINLRMVTESDLNALYQLHIDVDSRGNFFPLNLRSDAEFKKQYHAGDMWGDKFKIFLIVDAKTDQIYGTIIAFKPVFYQDSIEFGYILHDPVARGKGFVPEAVNLFTNYIFRFMNIFRVQLQIETENMASRRVAEKCGFTLEGTLRQVIIVESKPVDMLMYSITRDEWELMARH